MLNFKTADGLQSRLVNGSFEAWRGSSPHTDPAANYVIAPAWKAGATKVGTGVTYTWDTGNPFLGGHALEIYDNDLSVAHFAYTEFFFSPGQYNNRVLTVSARVRQAASNPATTGTLWLTDGTNTVSKDVTLTANYQEVVLRLLVTDVSLQLRWYPSSSTAGFTGAALIDQVCAVIGSYDSLPADLANTPQEPVEASYQSMDNSKFTFDASTLGPYSFYVPFSQAMRATPSVAVLSTTGSSNVASVTTADAGLNGFNVVITPSAVGFVQAVVDWEAYV